MEILRACIQGWFGAKKKRSFLYYWKKIFKRRIIKGKIVTLFFFCLKIFWQLELAIKAMIKKKKEKKGHWKDGDYIVHFMSEAWYAIW